MKEKYKNFTLAQDDQGKRLDRIARVFLPHQSLGALQKAFRRGDIRLDGQKCGPEDRGTAGQVLGIYGPLLEGKEDPKPRKVHKPVDQWLVYRDSRIAVFNKPMGLVVHGPDSLDASVKPFLKPFLPPSLSFQTGPLHRLDQTTSGLIVFSTSLEGAREFTQLMTSGRLKKDYLALVDGVLKAPLELEDTLVRDDETKTSRVESSGKRARTTIRPLGSLGTRTLVLCRIETGLTHQIRVQASQAGFPLWGDRKYGGSPGEICLHAWRLGFDPPWGDLQELEAPLPAWPLVDSALLAPWLEEARRWSRSG